jgi:hypothetical protein
MTKKLNTVMKGERELFGIFSTRALAEETKLRLWHLTQDLVIVEIEGWTRFGV